MAQPSVSSSIQSLFDVDVVAADLQGPGDPASLVLDEVERAQTMGENRRGEFAGGRACARVAMAKLGFDPQTPVPVDGRAPHWPSGLTGSITHTRGYCAAVVAQIAMVGDLRLGLDAELIGRVKPNLWRRVFVDAEQAELAASADAELLATVVFSVKEALYKAQYPVTGAWVGFEDVRVELAGDRQVTLHRQTELAALDSITWPVHGRWLTADERVTTAVALKPTR